MACLPDEYRAAEDRASTRADADARRLGPGSVDSVDDATTNGLQGASLVHRHQSPSFVGQLSWQLEGRQKRYC
jgi:hypothetical protein